MFKILDKMDLAAGVHRYGVEAPDIARRARPGQFVILRLDAHGERIPITIADAGAECGAMPTAARMNPILMNGTGYGARPVVSTVP